MAENNASFSNTDEYIATFPEDVQTQLQALRATIKAAAPNAVEKISYGMPAFALHGNLVYFAAWKSHIGFYPGAGGLPDALQTQLAGYESSKGAIKFPIDKPLPHALITEIVKHRVDINTQRAQLKAKRKKAKQG